MKKLLLWMLSIASFSYVLAQPIVEKFYAGFEEITRSEYKDKVTYTWDEAEITKLPSGEYVGKKINKNKTLPIPANVAKAAFQLYEAIYNQDINV